MTVSFQGIWDNHPYPKQPCDSRFKNQCAIRQAVAYYGAGVDLSTFGGALCYPGFGHHPKHVLRSQELAEWMEGRTDDFGTPTKKPSASAEDYRGMKGVVFIKDGWPSGGDHIDAWDGVLFKLRGGDNEWFERGAVWFWELT